MARYIIALLCLFTYIANAMRYYGHISFVDTSIELEEIAAQFGSGDKEIISILGTDDIFSQDVSEFLASADIYNVTLSDLFTSKTDEPDIEKRQQVDKVKCDPTVKVTDRLGPNVTKHLCRGLAAAITGSYGAVGAVLYDKKCNERATGIPITCKVLVAFSTIGGGYLIPTEFVDVCPYFLNIFDSECDSTMGELKSPAQNVGAIKTVSQKSVSCDDIEAPCTEINA